MLKWCSPCVELRGLCVTEGTRSKDNFSNSKKIFVKFQKSRLGTDRPRFMIIPEKKALILISKL